MGLAGQTDRQTDERTDGMQSKTWSPIVRPHNNYWWTVE